MLNVGKYTSFMLNVGKYTVPDMDPMGAIF